MLTQFRRALGHYYTIAPVVEHAVRPLAAPAGADWETTIEDDRVGTLPVTGLFSQRPAQRGLVIVVHGLGGEADNHYTRRAARAARACGLASLRLNLRGADRSGTDFYHAGLTTEVHAVFRELSDEFDDVYLLGYSLGGHVAMRFALEGHPKLRAVAAVCSPLDLARSAASLDQKRMAPYRRHVLSGLKEMYRALPAAAQVGVTADAADRIQSIVEWDDRIVAPRHGFGTAANYYKQMAVGPKLDEIQVPALYVGTRHDPMVLASDVEPMLERSRNVEVRWLHDGGHVGFPGKGCMLDDGQLESGVLTWLTSAASSAVRI